MGKTHGKILDNFSTLKGLNNMINMSSYRQILYHLIFRTKNSVKVLNPVNSHELFAYTAGIIKNKHSFLYRINGFENHIHMLCDLHPTIALADFMRDLKISTSIWAKQSGKFSGFDGWAEGYAALTYSWKEKDVLVSYIKNQQEHHKHLSFEEELREILLVHGVKIDEKYFP